MDDFELQNFIDEANFDQFVDLIRGESEAKFGGNFDCADYLINGLLVDEQFPIAHDQGQTAEEDHMLYYNNATTYEYDASNTLVLPDPLYYNDVPLALPIFEGKMKELGEDHEFGNINDEGEGEGEGEDYSSGTTTNTITNTTTTSNRKSITDRSRTLIAEQ